MEKSVLKVDGMSCEHCVKAITKAVGAMDGVDEVNVDLTTKTVTVTHDGEKAPLDKIKLEIEDQGYDIIL
ncbi:MAG: copper chaperone CopZ [Lachnospiraceae bacterium]|nr:copper chaperone CopZ [Lachnospiraceae bacterium]